MGAETVCKSTRTKPIMREWKVDGGAGQGNKKKEDTSNKEVEGGSAIQGRIRTTHGS